MPIIEEIDVEEEVTRTAEPETPRTWDDATGPFPPGWTPQKPAPATPLVQLAEIAPEDEPRRDPPAGDARPRKPSLSQGSPGGGDLRRRRGTNKVRFEATDSTGRRVSSRRGSALDDDAAAAPVTLPWAVSVLQAVVVTLPLVLLYGFFDYAVHVQFGFERDIRWDEFLLRLARVAPALALYVLVSTRLRPGAFGTEALYFIVAAASGAALVRIGTSDATFGGTLRSSGLAVLWIYTALVMNKWTALVSGLGVGGFYLALVYSGGPSRSTFLSN